MSNEQDIQDLPAPELAKDVATQALSGGGGGGGSDASGALKADEPVQKQAVQLLSALPFGVLLGAPLTAAVEAQTRSAMSTLNFVLTALYGKSVIQEVVSEESRSGLKSSDANEVIYVKFSYSTIEGTEVIEVPLISILPIPYIQVDNLDIDFNVNIAAVTTANKTTDNKVDYNGVTEASSWWGRFKVDTGITSNQTVHSDTTESINANYNMAVRMRASNVGMPRGLAKVMNMLEESVHARRMTEPQYKLIKKNYVASELTAGVEILSGLDENDIKAKLEIHLKAKAGGGGVTLTKETGGKVFKAPSSPAAGEYVATLNNGKDLQLGDLAITA